MKHAALLLLVCLAGCGRQAPPLEIFSDMRHQPKHRPQDAASRAPVPGTVARGQQLEEVAGQPPLSRALLERGQERFNIYCAPCHDRTGMGKGIVSTRSSWLAQDLTEPRIRQMPDAQIFDTITHGRRSMPGYRFQVSAEDRWAIVAYVRALQRAAAGTLDDVPPELRSELR